MEKVKSKKLNEDADDTVRKQIGTLALRLGRSALKAEGDRLSRINTGVALLNQAQSLVGVDNNKAKRLLNQVRRFMNNQ